MRVRVEIDAAGVAAAAGAIASFVKTADRNRRSGCRGLGGSFARDRRLGVTWMHVGEQEVTLGFAHTLTDLVEGASNFGWSTASGNAVRVVTDCGSGTGLAVVFDCRRDALHDSANGVGAVFRALGGVRWARHARILAVSDVDADIWWRCVPALRREETGTGEMPAFEPPPEWRHSVMHSATRIGE